MSATQERDQAARIASSDHVSALQIARNIDDPWFRCQALAYVAWHLADDKRFLQFVAESLESGWSNAEPNRSVTVVAWPVAALVRRDYHEPDAMKQSVGMLREAIARATEIIGTEPNPVRRADALVMQVHALSPPREELRKRVLGLLVQACREARSWKVPRQLEEAALVVAADDPDAAIGLTALLDENRKRRTIATIEAQSDRLGPRHFFDKLGEVRRDAAETGPITGA